MEFRILFIYASLWTWAFLVLKIAGSLNSPSVYQQGDVPTLSKVVQFTERFNLNNWNSYAKFIQSLRDKGQLRYKTSHGRPVLYPQEVRPTNFFDVALIVDQKEVTFRIWQDNLYLVGYKNAKNQWLEFNDSSPNNLITGSMFLGFNSSYDSLASKAGKNRGSIPLGKEQLKKAVSNLANSTVTQTRATGLTIVIQMISESMRFRSISTFLYTASGNPPLRLIELQTSWGHISEELLHRDSDPNHKFVPPSAQTGITNEVQAVEAIGIIKYFKFPQASGWNMEANNRGE